MEDIARVVEAQARFETATASLTDADMRRASQLPGWTVAHVLSHVARNADSHRRRAEAAERGEVVDQYPGGYEGREAEIDAGAQRTAAEVLDDVRSSAQQMLTAWQAASDAAWDRITRDVGGRERSLRELVRRRWQELEVHVVDLDVGVTHRDWPDDFVAAYLPKLRGFAGHPRLGVDLDERDELAWLYGRMQRDDLPAVPPWG
jgi:maleylpyruvate isomerase